MRSLSEELEALVGHEVTHSFPESFSGAEFRYYAMAIDDNNPRWQKGEAPPTFIVDSNQHVTERAELLRGGLSWELPTEGYRMLRGGHEYEFYRPVRAGDHVKSIWRITDVQKRTSSSGAELIIVYSELTFMAIGGEPLAKNRETIIFQALQ